MRDIPKVTWMYIRKCEGHNWRTTRTLNLSLRCSIMPIRYARGKPGMTNRILNLFFLGISLLELWIYHSTAQLCWLDVLEGKRSKTQQILISRYLYYMGRNVLIWKKKNMKVVTKTKKEKATHLGKESGPKLRNAFHVVVFIFIFFLMLGTWGSVPWFNISSLCWEHVYFIYNLSHNGFLCQSGYPY